MLPVSTASWKAARSARVSANGRCSNARSSAHGAPCTSPPKVSANSSSHLVDLVEPDERRPGLPGDAGAVTLADVEEQHVEQDGRESAGGDAAAEQDLRPGREGPRTPGTNVTNMAMPRLVLTMTMLRWSLKSTLASVWMPTTATVANMRERRAAQHRVRDPRDDRGGLRQHPRMIMMTPAAAITQRLLTWVSRTRPTFSEKQVYGNEFSTPPMVVARPSARRALGCRPS